MEINDAIKNYISMYILFKVFYIQIPKRGSVLDLY